MKLVLCENEPAILEAWRSQFQRHPGVLVVDRTVLEAPAEAIVNPGNSFGFMDGGLALKISEHFGIALEDAVRAAIRDRFGGEMLVGQAEVFPTGGKPPFLVHMPVHRTPQSIQDTVNLYLAARGAFAAVRRFNEGGSAGIDTIAFPGLGGGAGKVHPLIAARQLRYAYEEAMGLRKLPDQNLSRLARRERKLKEMPKEGQEGEE